ncbi:energy-coupling factor transporter transmembrane protein EcfT [Streptomyces sp. AC495_CC817]|uniref:energy-coupling factor transporter transmembrane protein EcfT n=1 Tax=Streptomyces sp. AC495_CC817 TaxID=2823900 RepID=UPI001C2621DA|nr:energy-coupling factor transporter transmembrane protein EcfT [Streptomyces sp. AC495_CC817]
MIQLYFARDSVVHRLGAGTKLLILAVCALVLSLVPQTAVSVAAVLAGVGGLYLLARLPLMVLGGEVWRLRWLIVVLGVALAVFVDPLAAWISTGRVVAIVLLAGLLTLTTRMGDLLHVLRRLLVPLRRIGVDPEAVGLTVALTITMVPVVAGFAAQVQEASRARGVRPGIRGVVPLMVRTLRHADEVGDALAARGIA